MGSVPVATLGPSWPACWHREFGGEINLEENLAFLFFEVAMVLFVWSAGNDYHRMLSSLSSASSFL